MISYLGTAADLAPLEPLGELRPAPEPGEMRPPEPPPPLRERGTLCRLWAWLPPAAILERTAVERCRSLAAAAVAAELLRLSVSVVVVLVALPAPVCCACAAWPDWDWASCLSLSRLPTSILALRSSSL